MNLLKNNWKIILIIFSTVFLVLAAIFFWLWFTRPISSVPKSTGFNNKVLTIHIKYDKSADPQVTISKIIEKPTTLGEGTLIKGKWTSSNGNNYTLSVVNKEGIRLFTKNFSVAPTIIADDTNFKSKLVNADAIEILEKMPSHKDGINIELIDASGKIIQKKSYISSGNTRNKVLGSSTADTTIAFVPYKYDVSDLSTYTNKVRSNITSLKTIPPYSTASNIEFYIYDNVVESLNCTQYPGVLSYCQECNWDAAEQALGERGITADHIVMVGKEETQSGACAPGKNITIPSNEIPGDGTTLIHELGHAVGKLIHEYVQENGGEITNTANFNCYRGEPPAAEWSQIILPNSYFKGCEKSNWYRSAEKSVMMSDRIATNYSPVGLWLMRENLNIPNTPVTPGTPNNPGTIPGDCVGLTPGVITKSIAYCYETFQINNGENGVIVVGADNITIDGGGVTLDGGSKTGYGIVLNGHSNVTIKNFTIKNYYTAIRLIGGSNNTIQDNVISNNSNAHATTPFHNINIPITQTPGGGILANNISSNKIIGNVGNNQDVGVNIYNSSGNTVSGNNFSNNNIWGIRLDQSSINTVSSNQANHVGETCGECDSAGILLVKGSESNTISNNNLTYSGDGFFIGNENGSPSDNNTISGNDGSYSPHNCFEATFSTGNVFTGNTANNCKFGFWLGVSTQTNVTNNTISNNEEHGIAWFQDGFENREVKPGIISGNTIIGNGQWGITIRADSAASNLDSFPASNTFSNNKSGNCDGTGFTPDDAFSGKCPSGATSSTKLTITPSQKISPAAGSGVSPSPKSATSAPAKCGDLGKNFGCVRPEFLGGLECSSTAKSETQNASCTGGSYCYECIADSNGAIKNVCEGAKNASNRTKYEGYIEGLCGGKSYNEPDARDGLFTGKPYSDVYQCGDEKVEIQRPSGNITCNKPPWNLKAGSGTNAPTVDPMTLCPAANYTCEDVSSCESKDPTSKHFEKGDFACTASNPKGTGRFCCTKPTASTVTPGTSTTTTVTPGTSICQNPTSLEDTCLCPNNNCTACQNGGYNDWLGAGKHCGGKYCASTGKIESSWGNCPGALEPTTATPSPSPLTPSPSTGGSNSTECSTCSKLGNYYNSALKMNVPYRPWGTNQCCAGTINSCVNSTLTSCPK